MSETSLIIFSMHLHVCHLLAPLFPQISAHWKHSHRKCKLNMFSGSQNILRGADVYCCVPMLLSMYVVSSQHFSTNDMGNNSHPNDSDFKSAPSHTQHSPADVTKKKSPHHMQMCMTFWEAHARLQSHAKKHAAKPLMWSKLA